VLFLWDLGNPDAPRQGTEGFYLQISKEMFLNNSFLTPLYHGSPHWSKPPLHFWLPFPLYSLLGEGHFLFAARFSIFLVFVASTTYLSFWLKRYLGTSFIRGFTFFAATFGILKYSRIFMMEIPLALITFSSLLLYFDYLSLKKKRYIIGATILMGVSILIKGPVSLVMTFVSLGLYQIYLLYRKEKGIFYETFKYLAGAFILAAIWFIACYLQHGQYFLDYFFLRENLGKFSAKSYPLRSVFQGLLLYGLPWTLFIPLFFKINYREFLNKKITMYLFFCFIVFFSIWLIPSQRSHHYALPSLPFFVILVFGLIFQNTDPKFQLTLKHYTRVINYLFLILVLFFIGLFSYALFLDGVPSAAFFTFNLIFVLGLLTLGVYCLLKKRQNPEVLYFAYLLFFGAIYCVSLTSFLLPVVPNKVISIVGDAPIGAIYRKPYFIAEALNREITPLNETTIIESLQHNDGYYILNERIYNKLKLAGETIVIYQWPVWQRGNKVPEIFQALINKDLSPLKEYLFLIKKKSRVH